jgi:hypothetical protein
MSTSPLTRIKRTILVCILALAALAAPASAGAKAKPKPVAPLFSVTLKGTQVSTWEHTHDPQHACDATIRGNGSQQINYDLLSPIKLKLVVPKGGRALLVLPKDTLAQYGYPGFSIPFRVVANREGSEETIIAPGGACNGTGNWDGTRPKRDCDEERHGRVDLQLGYAAYGINPAPRAGHLQVAGKYYSFIDPIPEGGSLGPVPEPEPTGVAEGEPLGQTFENCPYWAEGSASPSTDELVPAVGKLPLGKLRVLPKGKTVKASGHKRETYAEGDFKGDTLHTWNLKLKRIK